jgi:glycosyltransferase involved in cell wall biosynthesis
MISMRLAAVLQTPRDEHSAVLIGYRSLADHFSNIGCSLDILTPDDLNHQGYGRLVPLLFPGAVRRWALSHAQSYDLVIFHSYAGWRATHALEAAGVPYVVAFHGLEPLYHRELRRGAGGLRPPSWRYRLLQESLMPHFLRKSCHSATQVICLNTEEHDWLVSQGWAPGDRVKVLPHGVAATFFLPPRSARPLQTALFVGQWLPMKGVAYLVEAMNELMKHEQDLRLICAGTLTDATTVLNSFDPAVRDRVRVYPRIDRASLTRLYAEADVFVFPSLYEGFGRAIAEAMAARLPIVTTPVGVARDGLRDTESCLLVSARDAAAIVRSIQRLKCEPRMRSSLGDAAHAAATRYREADRTRQLADVLIGLARRPARRYPYRTA